MNVTFYRLPKTEVFKKWYNESTENFIFSLKGSRYITHIKRLNASEESVKRFFERIKPLKNKLGIVLWQFPPQMAYNRERLESFLHILKKYRVRGAFEFRHESWIRKETVNLLRKEGYALCMADWPPFNDILPPTADYIYIRRHGYSGSYDTCYSIEELRKDAKRIRNYLKDGLDVYIYFNNDACGYAPKNAVQLKELLQGL